MSFKCDGGGFDFSCDDAKFSIDSSTWNTRLSQIGKINGQISILTGDLPNINYISRIISKRPHNIRIISNTSSADNAKQLKRLFPYIQFSLHPKINAKIVLVAPSTVWVSSSDFGISESIESAVGFHSEQLYERVLNSLFNKILDQSQEILL